MWEKASDALLTSYCYEYIILMRICLSGNCNEYISVAPNSDVAHGEVTSSAIPRINQIDALTLPITTRVILLS